MEILRRILCQYNHGFSPSSEVHTSTATHLNSNLQINQIPDIMNPIPKQPTFCSEEPRLFNGRSLVDALLAMEETDPIGHSELIKTCRNHRAHENTGMPHGVCSSCRILAAQHIAEVHPELTKYRWWPLCQECSIRKVNVSRAANEGNLAKCSCNKRWYCYSCKMEKLEQRKTKIELEFDFGRDFMGWGGVSANDVQTVNIGTLKCNCGNALGPQGDVIECVGCRGLANFDWDTDMVNARAAKLTERIMQWT